MPQPDAAAHPVAGRESFTVEYVTDKSWAGYNWYQGNYRSLIQVNTDLPIFADRAIDLACHEGYPGPPRLQRAARETPGARPRVGRVLGVPAFSPQSLIAEGSANYGIDVAFPRAERLEFERSVIFRPRVSIRRADDYYAVLTLVDRLSYAGNEAARRYLDGADRRGCGLGVARAIRAVFAAARASSACDSSTSTAAT